MDIESAVYADKFCIAFVFNGIDLNDQCSGILDQKISRLQVNCKFFFPGMPGNCIGPACQVKRFLAFNQGQAQTTADIKGVDVGTSIQKPMAAF